MSLHILKSDWTTKDGKHWMNIGDGKEPYRASNRIPKEKEEKDHSDSERLKQLLDMRPVEVSGLSIDRLSRKEINLKAQNSFYKIQEQGISLSDGRKVVLTGRGLKKILSHSANEIVLHIIPRLKELIESSIYLFRETNNSKEKINIDYFESRSTKLSFGSRELFVRFVLIKEGNRVELLHYDHNLTDSSILNGAISPNPHQLTKPGEKEKLPTYDKLYQWAVNASKKTSNSNIQKSYSGESKMNQNIQKSTITQAVATTKRQLNFQNGLIDIFKARPIKYKFKIATGNPRRPYRYFYTEAEYKKYLDTSRATKKAKRDVKNQKPHTPSLVSSTPTEIGVGNETDVNNSSPKFELTQEKVSTPGERSVGSGPNLFGITERTESKYVNKNFQPEFNPSNDVNSIESLITEVKSQLLNAGLNDRAREWIEATYNTKSTMTNVFNLAYKFVRITGEVANSIRKQIIKASVNETKQQLFDPQVRKQLLESRGIDPETPVPRPNDIDIKNQKGNLDQSTPTLRLPLKQPENNFDTMPETDTPIITDRAEVQKIKNSIAEGESILRSGTSHGRVLPKEELDNIQRLVDRQKRKIGLLPGIKGDGIVPRQSENNFETMPEMDGKNKGEPRPIGYGDHGPIYSIEQFSNLRAGIDFLIRKQDGEIRGALSHPEIKEPIDLIWGKPGTEKSDGYGLSKLVKFHPEVLDDLQGIIGEMETIKPYSKNRMNLESKTHKASVRLFWDDKQKNWLLTAFEKKRAPESTTDILQAGEGMTAPSSSQGLDSIVSKKSQEEFHKKDGLLSSKKETLKGRYSLLQLFKTNSDRLSSMYRPEIGEIDFKLGNNSGTPEKQYHNGAGIKHIIISRYAMGLSTHEIHKLLYSIVDTIGKGKFINETLSHTKTRAIIEYEDTRVILAKEDRGNWILTGYKKKPDVQGKESDLSMTTHDTAIPSHDKVGAGFINRLIEEEKKVNPIIEEFHNRISKSTKGGQLKHDILKSFFVMYYSRRKESIKRKVIQQVKAQRLTA